jgi:predicted nucleotidyltransferase
MASRASDGLQRVLTAADDGTLEQLCRRHGIDLLGVFGSAVRQLHDPEAPDPHDLDIAVRFTGDNDILEVVNDLTNLAGLDEVDIAVLNRGGPVIRTSALTGLMLYEEQPGAWVRAQMAAIAEWQDTAHLRRLQRELLAS